MTAIAYKAAVQTARKIMSQQAANGRKQTFETRSERSYIGSISYHVGCRRPVSSLRFQSTGANYYWPLITFALRAFVYRNMNPIQYAVSVSNSKYSSVVFSCDNDTNEILK